MAGCPAGQFLTESGLLVFRVSAHGCLKFTGQKTGVGVYTEKPYVHITHIHTDHRVIKNGGWALTRENTLHWPDKDPLGSKCCQFHDMRFVQLNTVTYSHK